MAHDVQMSFRNGRSLPIELEATFIRAKNRYPVAIDVVSTVENESILG
jgi:hypothetical protein